MYLKIPEIHAPPYAKRVNHLKNQKIVSQVWLTSSLHDTINSLPEIYGHVRSDEILPVDGEKGGR